MSDPENIQEISALKPDYMGFIFYPSSPRFVESLTMEQLVSLREKGVEPVAVFVNESTKDILKQVEKYGFNSVQLHGTESPDNCSFLKRIGLIVFKAFSVAEPSDLEATKAYEGCCHYFLFDAKTPLFGGSGTSFDWNLLHQYTGKTPFFLSGGIGPDDAHNIRIFQHPLMVGVDLNSRFETAPALKNITLVQSFKNELNTK
jgi:phosphoribosylanthranilate isomerase